MKLNIKEYVEEQIKINRTFMNWCYNIDTDTLVKYLYEHTGAVQDKLKSKYYSISTHDFESLVYDSILSTIIHIGKVDSEDYLINYFKQVLTNNLKNYVKYQTQLKRHTDKISYIDNPNDKLKYTLQDQSAIDEFVEVDLMVSMKQELQRTKATNKQRELSLKYMKLKLSSNNHISDREICQTLNCDVKTLNRVKTICNNIIASLILEN